MSVILTNVSAGYSGTTVLRDVTLSVPTGSVVALLGPNGAGKTTLLRTACGSLTPERGDVTVDGADLTGSGSDRFAAAGVTLIPEGRGVFPSLTVEENLKLFAPARGGDLEPAYAAFPKLKTRRRQLAGTMSGGEQQMLALSRAYVRPSATVLLDEVSMGLAPLLVDEIFLALRDLADAGKSLLIVEQFATKALAMADVAYVLAGGRIVLAGEPCELDEETLSRAYLGSAA